MANSKASADQSRTTRMGSEGRSWIWDYAERLKMSCSAVGPSDFQMQSNGDGLWLSCTMRTLQEAEALREIIRVLAYCNLTAHRKMVHGDIYWTPPPPSETYAEKVARVFGPCVPA